MDIAFEDPYTQRRWDLSCPKVQREVLRMVDEAKPYFIMLSPPCRLYSQLQNLNPKKHSPAWRAERKKADAMLHFSMEIARRQHRQGRLFAFEHPRTAESWQDPEVMRTALMPGVDAAILDMCAYGLTATDKERPYTSSQRQMTG